MVWNGTKQFQSGSNGRQRGGPRARSNAASNSTNNGNTTNNSNNNNGNRNAWSRSQVPDATTRSTGTQQRAKSKREAAAPTRILARPQPSAQSQSGGWTVVATAKKAPVADDQHRRPPKPQKRPLQPTANQETKKTKNSGKNRKQNDASQRNATKSNKPKPQLKAMSLGDVITGKKGKGGGPTSSKKQGKLSAAAPSLLSNQDFPSLGAAAASTFQPPTQWSQAIQASKNTKMTAKATAPKPKPPPAKSKTKPQQSSKQRKPQISVSAAAFFAPKPIDHNHRDTHGEEHQLLRLLQERTVFQKKGKQRITTRKKKFSPLKKKILAERMRQWQATQTPAEPQTPTNTSRTVCIYHYTHSDELEDGDEYDEIVSNLKTMADDVATNEIHIARDLGPRDPYPVFVRFTTLQDAHAAVVCWDALRLMGTDLVAFPIADDDDGENWRDIVVTNEADLHNKVATSTSQLEVVLQNVLTQDDFDDEDCMEETMSDIRALMEPHCQIVHLVPHGDRDVKLTMLAKLSDVQATLQKLNGVLFGGQPIEARLAEDESASPSSNIVILHNVLTEDDLEDEDCMEESIQDIEGFAKEFGDVKQLTPSGRDVEVEYDVADAQSIAATIHQAQRTLGGSVVTASLKSATHATDLRTVQVHNLLTEEDLEDPDCLEESLQDIEELAASYGEVESITATKVEDHDVVQIMFLNADAAKAAQTGLDQTVLGGEVIQAKIPGLDATMPMAVEANGSNINSSTAAAQPEKPEEPKAMYSGDKLISERFAEMKRVPKIPNAGTPRKYATLYEDETVKPLLKDMLGELMRLQKRAVEEKNTKVRRRLVMGLREVARGIRAHKVKMVVMANNLDDYGAIDAKLQEIIDLGKSEGVPIFYEFSKRTLGKAIGKTIKMAVIGIQNAEGAHQEFKKLMSVSRS